jgi:hypothetical protein
MGGQVQPNRKCIFGMDEQLHMHVQGDLASML